MKRLSITLCIFMASIHIMHAVPGRGLAPHSIICFCKPVLHLYSDRPDSIQFPENEREMNDLIAEEQINKFTERGVVATYQGYVTFSDHNGQLLFPRKHTSDEMYYVITRSVRPVISHGETVQHWTIENPKTTRMYYLKRHHNEEQDVTYWNVTELDVEKGQKIPESATIIFSQPEHIIVPTGMFATINGGNLLLPDMYIKKSIPIGPNVLAFLRVNKYFAPVTYAYAYTNDRYATGMRP